MTTQSLTNPLQVRSGVPDGQTLFCVECFKPIRGGQHHFVRRLEVWRKDGFRAGEWAYCWDCGIKEQERMQAK
mgnify:CR=1 FL=1